MIKLQPKQLLSLLLGLALPLAANPAAIQLQAGRDLTARAATVASSQGAIQAGAGNDIRLEAGQNSQSMEDASQHTRKGFFSRTTTTTRDTRGQTQAQATTFSAAAIDLQAGNDIRLTGSNAVADGEAQLQAGNGITLEAATDTLNESHFRDEQKSGLFSNGGLSITLGKQQQTSTTQTTATQAAGSTLGSTGGDIDLQAQEGYRQSGSDLIAAQGDIAIDAGKVQIEAARETRQTTTQTQFQQSGLTLAVTHPVVSAVQTAQQMSQAAGNTGDGRMQVLAAAATGLAAKNAYDAVQAGQAVQGGNLADQLGGVNVSLSLGSSQSQSTTTQSNDTARGSSLQAGGDIAITATAPVASIPSPSQGEGQGGGDLLIQGSQLQAGNAIQLNATHQIGLQAAQNTARLQGSSNNSSASIGIGFGLGQGGAGASLTLSASQGKGSSGGTDLTWTNTQLTAGNSLDLSSGGDTTLQGATASAGQITAHVGGDLQIESLQDQSSYNSREQNLGGSLSVPLTPGGGFGASLNASRSQIDSTYASVTQQSGLQAGDQGFQIEAQGNTDLKGAVIASTQAAVDAGNNRLTTQTLTTSDIENQAEYQADSASLSAGVGTQLGGSAGTGSAQGQAESTSRAGVSGIAGNPAVRTGDAESGIAPIFDADKIQKEVQAQVAITQAFGQQASKAIGDYAAAKIREAAALRDQAGNEGDPERARELKEQAQTLEDLWGDQGTLRLAAHTIVGGLTGGINGAAGAAAGTLTAPEVAKALNSAGVDPILAKTLTAIASTAVGAAVGGTAGAGAALNEVTNNYLKHAEATRLEELTHKRLAGKCDSACENEIRQLEALDDQRNQELAACAGVSSQGCDNTRQEVRNAAAEYIRQNKTAVPSVYFPYGTEAIETQALAQGTMDGITTGAVQGAATNLAEGALALAQASYTGFKAAFLQDPQAQAQVMQGAGDAWEAIQNPDNWPYLLGAMTPADREKLAQAYEQGDGNAVGQILGVQATNLPLGSGLGTVKKIDALADVMQAGKLGDGIATAGHKVIISNDDFATWVKAADDPRAAIRIEKNANSFDVTDIYRGDLPSGSGSELLATGLKAVGVGHGDKVAFTGIINQETLTAYQNGIAAENSLLGRVGTNAITKLGMEVSKIEFQTVRGKLSILIEVK